jgi:hypothetical protein
MGKKKIPAKRKEKVFIIFMGGGRGGKKGSALENSKRERRPGGGGRFCRLRSIGKSSPLLPLFLFVFPPREVRQYWRVEMCIRKRHASISAKASSPSLLFPLLSSEYAVEDERQLGDSRSPKRRKEEEEDKVDEEEEEGKR